MALDNTGISNMDMTGKLIIKASLGDDIRRIPIHNDDLTYDELVLMMQRVFKGVLDPEEDLLLKYKDEDGDLITITDNSDLSFAIQYCRVLRLAIIVGGEGNKKVGTVGIEVTKELREIRDRVNKLLDMVSDSSKGPSDSVGGGEPSEGGVAEEAVGHVGQISQVENREFDPLGQEQVQQETPASSVAAEAAPAVTADTTSSFSASQSSGYQAPDLSSFTPTPASSTLGYQQYGVSTASTAPPSGVYPVTTSTSAGYQAPPSLAPPTSGYLGAPSLAPPTSGYPVTTASQAPPPSGFPTTTAAHQPHPPPTAAHAPPTAAGYQASTSATLPPSTPSYPTASYPTQPPPNASFPRPSSTPSTVPPTSYAYPSPQPHYSPYHPPNYPPSPAGYPTQPPNPYSRGPPTSQQGYQHPGMGTQQQQ